MGCFVSARLLRVVTNGVVRPHFDPSTLFRGGRSNPAVSSTRADSWSQEGMILDISDTCRSFPGETSQDNARMQTCLTRLQSSARCGTCVDRYTVPVCGSNDTTGVPKPGHRHSRHKGGAGADAGVVAVVLEYDDKCGGRVGRSRGVAPATEAAPGCAAGAPAPLSDPAADLRVPLPLSTPPGLTPPATVTAGPPVSAGAARSASVAVHGLIPNPNVSIRSNRLAGLSS